MLPEEGSCIQQADSAVPANPTVNMCGSDLVGVVLFTTPTIAISCARLQWLEKELAISSACRLL